ncbi:MAG: natural resistance-associated macrophage protein, partial [uncultured bacterium]
MIFPNLFLKNKMREFFKKIKNRILIFLAVLGPGIITAVADNDAAGVATYSLAGAKFGYSILYLLIIITVLLAVTQEMGARIAIISGKGLGDLIREKNGLKISVFVFLLLFVVNLGTIVANFSGFKIALQMFHLPVIPSIFIFIILSFIFVTKGNYRNIQNIFLIGLFFYFAYLIAAFKAEPDWFRALGSLVLPLDLKISREYIFASIAVLGTTITPWGQFFVHSYYIDKKITPDKIKYVRLETYLGAFVTDFFTFFMIVATAAALFAHKIPLTSGE